MHEPIVLFFGFEKYKAFCTDRAFKKEGSKVNKQKQGSLKSSVFAVLIMLVCILVNCVGRQVAHTFSLPCWLDTFGTFFAAYTMGPVSGAVIGVSSNVIFSIWRTLSAAYCVVSIFIGITAGLLARKKYFDTIFHTMTVAGAIASGSVIISSLLNIFLNDSQTSNLWGDGVKEYMLENGINKTISLFIGEFYIEFPDKLVTALSMFLLIKIVRKVRKNKSAKKLAKQATAAASAAALFLTVLVPLSDITANAQYDDSDISYIQTVYNNENGLPCGHANAIAQTNDGILWIGTYAGLYRYSGSEFLHLKDIEEIRNVNCLYVDSESRLWVGTNDNGLVIMINNKVANVINSQQGLPSDSIRSIVQSADGDYYIGTSSGTVTLELKIGLNIKHQIPEVGYVDRMSADSAGNVAAVNNEGRLFILRDSKVVSKLENANGKKISSCKFAQDGTLYAGTTQGIINHYMLEGDSFSNIHSINCSGITKINNIYPDMDGLTWICSDSGIGRINQRGVFTPLKTGGFGHSVESMVCDYQGNLWFASSRLGLLRMSISSVKDIYADTGVERSVVNTTAIRSGLLYAGTDDGLNIISTVSNKSYQTSLTELLKGTRIRCMITDYTGNLWICSYGKGLISVDRYGKITQYTKTLPEIGERVRVCTELSDGTIAASSSNGLFFIKNGKIKSTIPYDEKIGHSQILCFMQGKDGTLYAGTDGNGILVIRNYEVVDKLTHENGLSSEVILRIVADTEDNGFFIVTSNSIGYLRGKTVKTLKNFPYSNNYDVILNRNGDVLVPGSAGIYILNREKLLDGETQEPLLVDSEYGLICSLTANAWNACDKLRNLYLSSNRGVFCINLDNYIVKQKSFRLMVSEVRIDDNVSSIDRDSQLKIDRDVSKIEFVPEIINYSHDDPTVSYYLEGFEDSWNDVAQSEIKSFAYTNLKPGSYTLHLAIRDNTGNIVEESTYDILKEKAIYDNPWFKVYMIVVAGIFIGWLTWFITRTNMQHTLELQQTKLTMALQQVQMGNETILAIAKTVDAKDLRTSKHSQRVSEYSAMIAKEYGFTDEQCENLRKAALLHDIGKIAIPDNVLNKPARLTDEEYAVMKSHVTRGAEILKDFTLIDHVVEGARYHHERYDGRGYPDGLKGEEIPLYGRIIAIADAFDAMTANRVYRQKQDFDYVLNELQKNRGTQFDPDLLDIFLKLIDDKKIDIDALYRGEHQKGEE